MKRVVSIVAAIVVVTTLGVSNSYAQRDSGAKARREYNTGFWHSSSRQRCVVRTRVCPSEPQTAKADVPETVAQQDAQEKSYRRFSYEPSGEVQQRPARTFRRRSSVHKPTPPEVRLGRAARHY